MGKAYCYFPAHIVMRKATSLFFLFLLFLLVIHGVSQGGGRMRWALQYPQLVREELFAQYSHVILDTNYKKRYGLEQTPKEK